jgi:hypothetical protein
MRQNHPAVQDGKSPSQARATIPVTVVIGIVTMSQWQRMKNLSLLWIL